MFSTLKGYLLAAVGVIAAVFGAMLAYQRKKIGELKKAKDVQGKNIEQLKSVIEAEQAENKKMEKVNEIMYTADSKSAVVGRLRERAAARDNKKSK